METKKMPLGGIGSDSVAFGVHYNRAGHTVIVLPVTYDTYPGTKHIRV